MRFTRLGPAVCGCALTLAMACDSGLSARAQNCRKFCEALEKCDDDTDLMGCEDKCSAQDFRSEHYFEAKASCTAKLSCNEFHGEFGPQGEDQCNQDCAVADCVTDTLADVKLSDEQQQLCEAVSTKLDGCDSSLDSGDVARNCEKLLPTLSDEYVAQSKLCIDSACSAIVDCLDEAANHYNTDVKLYSGPLMTH